MALFTRTVSDYVTVADSVVRRAELHAILSDTIGMSDSVAPTVKKYLAVDTIAMTDEVSVVLDSARAAADAIQITDVAGASFVLAGGADDTIEVSDSAVAYKTISPTVDDTIEMSDEASRVCDTNRFVADAIEVSDQAEAGFAKLAEPAEDAIEVSDSVEIVLILGGLAEDTIEVTDEVTRVAEWLRAPWDAINVTDSATRVCHCVRTIEDAPIEMTDSVEVSRSCQADDTIEMTDSVEVSRVLHRVIDDTIEMTDSVGLQGTAGTIALAVSDSPIAMTDSATRETFVSALQIYHPNWSFEYTDPLIQGPGCPVFWWLLPSSGGAIDLTGGAETFVLFDYAPFAERGVESLEENWSADDQEVFAAIDLTECPLGGGKENFESGFSQNETAWEHVGTSNQTWAGFPAGVQESFGYDDGWNVAWSFTVGMNTYAQFGSDLYEHFEDNWGSETAFEFPMIDYTWFLFVFPADYVEDFEVDWTTQLNL